MSRTCVYCGSNDLSKEHVWPKSLISAMRVEMAAYSGKRNHVVDGEPVIRDVCRSCNEGALSLLDNRFVRLTEMHGLLNEPPSGQGVRFEFSEPSVLLRMLLKVSFNSSRTDGRPEIALLHKRFIPFIMGSSSFCPKVQVRLQVVTCSTEVDLKTGERKTVCPKMLHCREVAPVGSKRLERFVFKWVMIASNWFLIIFSKKKEEPTHIWKEMETQLPTWLHLSGKKISLSEPVDLSILVNETTFYDPKLLFPSLYSAEWKINTKP
jgi:hypothetical protein